MFFNSKLLILLIKISVVCGLLNSILFEGYEVSLNFFSRKPLKNDVIWLKDPYRFR
jgi:hypothetical protein